MSLNIEKRFRRTIINGGQSSAENAARHFGLIRAVAN